MHKKADYNLPRIRACLREDATAHLARKMDRDLRQGHMNDERRAKWRNRCMVQRGYLVLPHGTKPTPADLEDWRRAAEDPARVTRRARMAQRRGCRACILRIAAAYAVGLAVLAWMVTACGGV